MLPISQKPETTAEMPLGTSYIITSKQAKAGKSTMAATARGVLMLDFERRLNYIEAPRLSPLYISGDPNKLQYPFNVTFGDVWAANKKNCMDWLKAWLDTVHKFCQTSALENGYKTIVFDSLDALVNIGLECYVRDYGWAGDNRLTYRRFYNAFLPIMKKFTLNPTIDTCFICQTSEFEGADGQKYVLTLPPFLLNWFTSQVQWIGMLYTPGDNGPNRLWTANRNGWPTGDGTGRLRPDLPAHMDAVYACWTNEDPEQYQPGVVMTPVSNPIPPAPKRKAAAQA